MARIKYTALVESIRGSIGGTTFQKNAYGYTVKSKPNMLNPNTSRQNASKQLFSVAAQKWRNLTDPQRAAWDAYANAFPIPSRKNPDAYLSGFAAFVRWHGISQYFGNPTLSNPSGAQGTVTNFTPFVGTDGSILNMQPDVVYTNGPWNIFVFCTRPIQPTQTFIKSWLRFVFATNQAGSVDFNFQSGYLSRFGFLPAAGQIIGVQLAYVNTTNGQVYYFPAEQVIVAAL